MFNPVHWRREIFVDLHNDDFLWACMVCPSFEFEDLELLQLNDPFLCHLLCMGIADWMGVDQCLHQATQVIHHSTAIAMRLTDCILFGEKKVSMPTIPYDLVTDGRFARTIIERLISIPTRRK